MDTLREKRILATGRRLTPPANCTPRCLVEKYVELVTARMMEAINPDDVVLGGGNAQKLKRLPKGCRLGNNAYAFIGGFRLWENASSPPTTARASSRRAA